MKVIEGLYDGVTTSWQITKIFELSQLRQDRDDSQIANYKDNN